jgi:hypothetical protein
MSTLSFTFSVGNFDVSTPFVVQVGAVSSGCLAEREHFLFQDAPVDPIAGFDLTFSTCDGQFMEVLTLKLDGDGVWEQWVNDRPMPGIVHLPVGNNFSDGPHFGVIPAEYLPGVVIVGTVDIDEFQAQARSTGADKQGHGIGRSSSQPLARIAGLDA